MIRIQTSVSHLLIHQKKLFLCLLLLGFLCLLPFHFGFSDEQTLKKYQWSKRILVLVTKSNQNQLIKKVASFFDKYKCENFERDIILKRYKFSDIISNAVLGPEFHNTGLWLIGYDGHIKAYSPDEKILNQIHDLIDSMPLRKLEMSQNKSVCD